MWSQACARRECRGTPCGCPFRRTDATCAPLSDDARPTGERAPTRGAPTFHSFPTLATGSRRGRGGPRFLLTRCRKSLGQGGLSILRPPKLRDEAGQESEAKLRANGRRGSW